MRKYVRKESLVGRQVCFKLNKDAFLDSDIIDLMPNKLYTIEEHTANDAVAYIKDDVGYKITIWLPSLCSHLDKLANWSLKQPSKTT